ncbi:MAG: hypothetical protein ACRD1G_16810 [Acidimicrobiales bacterium]
MLCLAGAFDRRIAPCGSGPGTARTAPAATNRTTLGRWFLIRFDSVSVLISLTVVAV